MGQDPQAILAPQKAVLRDLQGKPYVYVLKDGKAERRFITVSHTIGNDWYVTSGLQAGEKIILNGVNNVRSGMTVQEVSQTDSQAAPENSDQGKKTAGGSN